MLVAHSTNADSPVRRRPDRVPPMDAPAAGERSLGEQALTVIVLAWNQLPLTRRCVESVRANTDVPYELVIVDNGSDAEAAAYARQAADVPVLHPTNLGFAAGMNSGLAVATGTHVAFVNNDTELPPGWAGRLIETLWADRDVGLVLPAVTAAGNPYAVRTEPGPHRIVVPPFRHLPSGVVYAMRRNDAEALGGWSEEFEVASREDLDLLFKVWCNDLGVVLDERVLVWHESSATVREQLPDRRDRWEKNWDVFVEKWTAADPGRIPRLASCEPDVFEANLDRARIAATWMERWYDARFRTVTGADPRRLAAVERERDDLAERLRLATSAKSRFLRSGWTAVRRVVPRSVREWAFPKLRALYYAAFPERRGGRRPEERSAAPERGDDRRQ